MSEISTSRENVRALLGGLQLEDDGIYGYEWTNPEQEEELRLRTSVAEETHSDYLRELGRHHSIRVMDREVRRFLAAIPRNGIVLDIGGGAGWHWRKISESRPDVCVVIVDFVRAQLIRARDLLAETIGENVFLVHADASQLELDDESVDGYWSVQTLQHVPDYSLCIRRAHSVLKKEGVFANYSLNAPLLVRWTHALFRKPYHIQGERPGAYPLSRASDEQLEIVESVFGTRVRNRYSEILFHPDLKLHFSGKPRSLIGWVDSHLTSHWRFLSIAARQRSFHTVKNSW